MRLLFDSPANGTELVREVSGPNPPRAVEVCFEPSSPTERLVGEPSEWCNVPGPGETLVYNVPVRPDGTTNGALTVSSSTTPAGIQVPITIKHNL